MRFMEVVRLPDLLGKDNIFVSMTDAMDYAQVRHELLSSRCLLAHVTRKRGL